MKRAFACAEEVDAAVESLLYGNLDSAEVCLGHSGAPLFLSSSTCTALTLVKAEVLLVPMSLYFDVSKGLL
jgi:hypothetical protein